MRRAFGAGLAFVVFALATTPTLADFNSENLAQCMVRYTSQADQLALVRWTHALQSADSSAQGSPETDKKVGALLTRLLTTDCRKQTLAALKSGGPAVIENALGELSETPMFGITTRPKTKKGLENWSKVLDEGTMVGLLQDSWRSSGPRYAPPPVPRGTRP